MKLLGNYKSRRFISSFNTKELKEIKNEINNIKSNYLKKKTSYTQVLTNNNFVFEDVKTFENYKKDFNKSKNMFLIDSLFYNNSLNIDFINVNNKHQVVNLMNILFIGIGYQKLFDYHEEVKIGHPSFNNNDIPKKQFLILNTFSGITYYINETYQSFMKRLSDLEKQYKLNNPIDIKDGDEKICWLQTSNGYEFFGKVRFRQEPNWEDFMYIEKYNSETKKYDQLERRRVKCFGKKYLTPDLHIWDIPEDYPNMLKGLYAGSNEMYKERL